MAKKRVRISKPGAATKRNDMALFIARTGMEQDQMMQQQMMQEAAGAQQNSQMLQQQQMMQQQQQMQMMMQELIPMITEQLKKGEDPQKLASMVLQQVQDPNLAVALFTKISGNEDASKQLIQSVMGQQTSAAGMQKEAMGMVDDDTNLEVNQDEYRSGETQEEIEQGMGMAMGGGELMGQPTYDPDFAGMPPMMKAGGMTKNKFIKNVLNKVKKYNEGGESGLPLDPSDDETDSRKRFSQNFISTISDVSNAGWWKEKAKNYFDESKGLPQARRGRRFIKNNPFVEKYEYEKNRGPLFGMRGMDEKETITFRDMDPSMLAKFTGGAGGGALRGMFGGREPRILSTPGMQYYNPLGAYYPMGPGTSTNIVTDPKTVNQDNIPTAEEVNNNSKTNVEVNEEVTNIEKKQNTEQINKGTNPSGATNETTIEKLNRFITKGAGILDGESLGDYFERTNQEVPKELKSQINRTWNSETGNWEGESIYPDQSQFDVETTEVIDEKDPNTEALQNQENVNVDEVLNNIDNEVVDNEVTEVATDNFGVTDDMTFSQAYRTARDAGATIFTWQGKEYGTKSFSEMPQEYQDERTDNKWHPNKVAYRSWTKDMLENVGVDNMTPDEIAERIEEKLSEGYTKDEYLRDLKEKGFTEDELKVFASYPGWRDNTMEEEKIRAEQINQEAIEQNKKVLDNKHTKNAKTKEAAIEYFKRADPSYVKEPNKYKIVNKGNGRWSLDYVNGGNAKQYDPSDYNRSAFANLAFGGSVHPDLYKYVYGGDGETMYESGGELNKYQESPSEVSESGKSGMPKWYPKYREELRKLEAEKDAVYESYGAIGQTVPQSVKEQLNAKYKSFMIDSGMEHGEATPTWMDGMLAKAEPGYIDAAGLSGYPAGLRRIDVKRLGFHQNDPKGIADFLEEVRNYDRPPMSTKGPNKVVRSFKPMPTNPIEKIRRVPGLYGMAYGGELDQYRRRGSVFGTKAIQAVPYNRALTGRTGAGGVSDMYTMDAEGNKRYLTPQEIQAMTSGSRLKKVTDEKIKNALFARNRKKGDPRKINRTTWEYDSSALPSPTTTEEGKQEVTVDNLPPGTLRGNCFPGVNCPGDNKEDIKTDNLPPGNQSIPANTKKYPPTEGMTEREYNEKLGYKGAGSEDKVWNGTEFISMDEAIKAYETITPEEQALINKEEELQNLADFNAENNAPLTSTVDPSTADVMDDPSFSMNLDNTKYFTSKSNDYIPGDIDPAYQASTDVYEDLVLGDPWLSQKDYSNPFLEASMEDIYNWNPEDYGLSAVEGGNLVDAQGNVVVERENPGFYGKDGFYTTPINWDSDPPNQQRGGGLDSFVYGGSSDVGYMSDFDIEQFRRAGGEIEFI